MTAENSGMTIRIKPPSNDRGSDYSNRSMDGDPNAPNPVRNLENLNGQGVNVPTPSAEEAPNPPSDLDGPKGAQGQENTSGGENINPDPGKDNDGADGASNPQDSSGDEGKVVASEEEQEKLLFGIMSDGLNDHFGYNFEKDQITDMQSLVEGMESSFIQDKVMNPESEVHKKIEQMILDKHGINDDILATASSNTFAFDQSMYNDYVSINNFANQEITTSEDMVEIFRIAHIMNNVPENLAENYAKRDLLMDPAERQKYLKEVQLSVAQKTKSEITRMESSREDVVKRFNAYKNDIYSQTEKLLKSGKINGKSYTQDQISKYREMIYGKDHEITLPTGAKTKVSAFKKKLHELPLEARLQRDIDFALQGFTNEEVKRKNQEVSSKKQMGSIMSQMNTLGEKGRSTIDTAGSFVKKQVSEENRYKDNEKKQKISF